MGWSYQQKPPMGWPLDLDSGLGDFVGAWFFLEGTGDRVFDLSGNGNHLDTISGTPIWEPAKFGSGIGFSGGASTDYLKRSSALVGANIHGTVIFWCKVRNINDGDHFLSQDNRVMQLDISSSKMYVTQVTSVGWGFKYSGTVNIVANVWEHWAITWNATTSVIYRNGKVEVINNTPANPPDKVPDSLYIATDRTTAGTEMDVVFDHLLWYNRSLSASEIIQLYQKPFCMFKDPAEITVLDQYYTVTEGGIMTPNTRYWGAL